MKSNHFIFFQAVTEKGIVVIDPPKDAEIWTRERLESVWSGRALLFERPARRPCVSLPKSEIDLGQVHVSADVPATIPIQNTGTAPLLIGAVSADCGCKVTKFPTSLKPGETNAIQVIFHTGKCDTGLCSSLVKTIKVSTNDQDTPEALIMLRAQVRPEFTAEPPLVQFMFDSDENESFQTKIRLERPWREPAEIISAACDLKGVQVELSREEEGLLPFLTCKVPAAALQFDGDDLRGSIRVRTNIQSNGEIEVPLIFRKGKRVLAFPDEILFVLENGKPTNKKTVEIESATGESFKILSILPETSPLNVHMEPVDGLKHKLIIALRENSSASALQTGEIVVCTTIGKKKIRYTLVAVPK